jgi:hypothetical protein
VLLRSMCEPVWDLYLCVGDDRVLESCVHLATVEQALLALAMDEKLPSPTGRDLAARRRELAAELRARLKESHPIVESALAAEADLQDVLAVHGKTRFGRRRPRSWQQEFMHTTGLTRPPTLAGSPHADIANPQG